MGLSFIGGVFVTLGAVLLGLGSVPMENTLEGNTLTVKFIIRKKSIDMADAKFHPVPPEATQHLIRVGGTSIGNKRSGNFKNTRTGTKYVFYLTGKGEKTYFEIGDKKYLVDDIPHRD
jgi:hypothetical protein